MPGTSEPVLCGEGEAQAGLLPLRVAGRSHGAGLSRLGGPAVGLAVGAPVSRADTAGGSDNAPSSLSVLSAIRRPRRLCCQKALNSLRIRLHTQAAGPRQPK